MKIPPILANPSLRLLRQSARDVLGLRNTFGDKLKISDRVLMYEGSADDVLKSRAKLRVASKGHIVDYGLIGLMNIMGSVDCDDSDTYSPSNCWNYANATSKAWMRLGTGGSITTSSTGSLTAELGNDPNTQSGMTQYINSTYRLSYIASWNAGALPAVTITEAGLFLYVVDVLKTFGWAYNANPYANTRLFSRLSEADGDFTGVAINTAIPFTLEWRFIFEFA